MADSALPVLHLSCWTLLGSPPPPHADLATALPPLVPVLLLDWPTTAPLCPLSHETPPSKQEPWAWGIQTLPPQSQSCPSHPAWVAAHTSRNFPPSLPLRADCNPQAWQSGYRNDTCQLSSTITCSSPPPHSQTLSHCSFSARNATPATPSALPLSPPASQASLYALCGASHPPRSGNSLPLSQQAYLLPWSQILIVLFVCVPDKLGGSCPVAQGTTEVSNNRAGCPAEPLPPSEPCLPGVVSFTT